MWRDGLRFQDHVRLHYFDIVQPFRGDSENLPGRYMVVSKKIFLAKGNDPNTFVKFECRLLRGGEALYYQV